MPQYVSALDDADLPLMLLGDSAITHNIRVMATFCADNSVHLAPHAKTHMSEELCRRQIQAGAWGMTAATPAQVRALAGFGIERILHANLLVDRAAIEWVARTFLDAVGGGSEYCCYVDSVDGLTLLEAELARLAPAAKLRVLLEVGFAGGRTGLRSDTEAIALAHAVAESSYLELVGVAGFEGLMPLADGSYPAEVPLFLARMHALTEYCASAGLFAGTPIVTAGGSSFFDLVVDHLGPDNFTFPVTCVLRSGCYITHDHGLYERTSPFGLRGGHEQEHFVPALELLASVLSRPEPDRVIVGFGRREAPTDAGLPVVLGRLRGVPHEEAAPSEDTVPHEDTAGWEVTGVNDHHAFLRVPVEATVSPGDVLRFGISHPCGAFDRWRSIPLVDDQRRVIGTINPVL